MHLEQVRKEWSYTDKVAFCFQAPIYMVHNNVMSFPGFLKKLFLGK